MKVPIPNDWDGESWQCIRVQFPDSIMWTAILTGLLSYLTRGRFWDEKTGSIIDTQAIGWEIFDRAWPPRSCDSGTPQTPDSDVDNVYDAYNACAAFWDEWEDIKVGIIDLEWRGNTLYMRKLPCCDWFPVLQSGTQVTTVPGTQTPLEITQPAEDPLIDPRCRQAAAITAAIRDVVEEVYSRRHALDCVFKTASVLSGYTLDKSALFELQLLFVADDIDWTGTIDTDITDADYQRLQCQINAHLTGSDYGISQLEYASLQSVIAFDALLNDSLPIGAAFNTALVALGSGTVDDVAKAASNWSGDEPDCSCPESTQIFLPGLDTSVLDWLYIYDFTQQPYITPEPAGIDWIAGVGWTGDTSRPSIGLDTLAGGATLTYMYFKYAVPPGQDYNDATDQVARLQLGTGPNLMYTQCGDADPSLGGTFEGFVKTSWYFGGVSTLIPRVFGSPPSPYTLHDLIIMGCAIGGTGTPPGMEFVENALG